MQVVREHRDDLVRRVRVLTAVVTGVLVAIATGFWFTQLVQGELLPRARREQPAAQAADQGAARPDLRPQGAPAGRERPQLQPDDRPQPRGRASTTASGSPPSVLGRPVAELHRSSRSTAACRRSSRCSWPRTSALSEVARFGVEGLDYPEFEVEVQHLRLYRHREQTAHILGYLGEPSLDEIAEVERRLPAGRHGRQEGGRADLPTRSCAARTASAPWWWTAAASSWMNIGRLATPSEAGTWCWPWIWTFSRSGALAHRPGEGRRHRGHGPPERRDPGPGLGPRLQPQPVRRAGYRRPTGRP